MGGGEKRKAELHLSFGGQAFHAVGFEEGEVDHGLEQRDGFLRVTGLAQEVALLQEERWKQADAREPGYCPQGKKGAPKAQSNGTASP